MKTEDCDFIKDKRRFADKSLIFSKSSQLFLLMGFCAFFAGVIIGHCGKSVVAFGLLTVSLTLFFILSPFLAIIGNLMLSFKTNNAKVSAILITELAVLFLIGPRCLPYLYASPALSPKKLEIYSDFIEFTSKVKWQQSIYFGRSSVSIDDVSYDIYSQDNALGDVLSDSKIVELKRIHRALKRRNLHGLTRGEWVCFFRMNTSFRPLSSGVLYSMNGNNPNESNMDEIKKLGPFVQIEGNWYTSEKITKYHRTAFPLPVTRQSLIDRSLPKEVKKELRGAETIQFGPR